MHLSLIQTSSNLMVPCGLIPQVSTGIRGCTHTVVMPWSIPASVLRRTRTDPPTLPHQIQSDGVSASVLTWGFVMPYRPRARCRHRCSPPCAEKQYRGGRCKKHYLEMRRASDVKRGSGGARGWTSDWSTFRQEYLLHHPRCECATHMAMPYWARPIATDINHLHGRSRLSPDATDPSHCQALAHECHSKYTAFMQPGGWNARQG